MMNFRCDENLDKKILFLPFIFLIIYKGFNILMKKVVDMGKFVGYKFERGKCCFSHLQYAYETMIISEKRWSNTRIIKIIQHLFKAMFSLKVNFHKGLIVGINVSQNKTVEVTTIQSCKVGFFPLNYCSLQFWVNLNRKDT